MTKIIQKEYKLEEEIIFSRDQPHVKVMRAKLIVNGNPYIIKIWQIYTQDTTINIYQKKFQNQNALLREIPQGLGTFLPKLIESQLQARVKQTSQQMVAYQIFEDIKYNNIMSYHHKRQMLPESIGTHLFKKIVQAIKILNSTGKTFYNLNPTYIMIDQHLNPIFMDLSNVRSLNHAENVQQIDSYEITSNFKSPEMFKKKGTYSLIKMDSYQLGVLGIVLIVLGNPPFNSATQMDQNYNMFTLGNYQLLFKAITPKQKVISKNFKQMIASLIAISPEARTEPKSIIGSIWWQQTTPIATSQQLDQFINRILEAKKKQQFNLSVNIRSNEQQPRQAKNPLFSMLQERNCSESFTHLTDYVFQGKVTDNIYYWPLPIYQTFVILRNKSKHKFNAIQQSTSKFQFIVYMSQSKFKMQVSCYSHPNIKQSTVVKYKLLNSDQFYYDQAFQQAKQYYQKQNTNQ